MPMQRSCMPPIKNIMQARLGQPDTGSPKIRVFAIITTIIIAEIKQNSIPKIEEITSGMVEKATIPSME